MFPLNRAQQVVGLIWLSVETILAAILVTPAIVGDEVPSAVIKEVMLLALLVAVWGMIGMAVVNEWDAVEVDEEYEEIRPERPQARRPEGAV
jgi:hypothetical protein